MIASVCEKRKRVPIKTFARTLQFFTLMVCLVSNLAKAANIQAIGEILPNVPAEQSFRPTRNYLDAVSVELATYARPNSCELTLELRRLPSRELIASRTLNGSEIADNNFYFLEFPPIPDSAQVQFLFKISSIDATPGNAVTAWNNLDSPSNGNLVLGGQAVRGELIWAAEYNAPLPRLNTAWSICIVLLPLLILAAGCLSLVKATWDLKIKEQPGFERKTGLALILGLVLWYLSVQIPVYCSTVSVDGSFIYVINWLSFSDRPFGTEIIYTCGPLGFLVFPEHINQNLMLACIWWPVMYLLLASMLSIWIVSLFDGLKLAVVSVVAMVAVYFLATDQFVGCFALLIAFVGFGLPELRNRALAIGALLAAIGILLKFSMGLSCIAALGGSALFPFKARDIMRRVGVLAGVFSISLLVIWMALYQTPTSIPGYFFSSLELASGYTAVMAVGQQYEGYALLGFILVICILIALASALPREKRLHALFAIIGPLFFVWKHGTVRLDTHIYDFSITCLFCAMILLICHGETLLSRWKAIAGAAALCSIFLLLDRGMWLVFWTPQEPVWTSTVAAMRTHAVGFDFFPGSAYTQALDNEMRRQCAGYKLPATMLSQIGDDPVDIYSFDLGFVAANPLNFHFKPVFQHFNAFTPKLDRLHAEFYKSTAHPAYIIYYNPFEMHGIDMRHILFDDPIAQRVMFNQYRPIAIEHNGQRLPVALLKATDEKRFEDPVLLDRVEAGWNENIPVPPNRSGILRARIFMNNSVIRKGEEFLFRLSPIELVYTLSDGTESKFRLVPPHMADGVWIAPFFPKLNSFYQYLDRKPFSGPDVTHIRFEAHNIADYPEKFSLQWEHTDERQPLIAGKHYGKPGFVSPAAANRVKAIAVPIEAPFPLTDRAVEAIGIKLSTYNLDNTGPLTLEMLDADAKVLATSQLDASEVYDNSDQIFLIPADRDVTMRCRRLRLSYRPAMYCSLAFWCDENSENGFNYEVFYKTD